MTREELAKWQHDAGLITEDAAEYIGITLVHYRRLLRGENPVRPYLGRIVKQWYALDAAKKQINTLTMKGR